MTNENVILILEQIRTHYDGTCKEALDIAIKALQEYEKYFPIPTEDCH